MEVSGQLHTLAAIPLGTCWIGVWVGPRAVVDVVVKGEIPSTFRESNLRTLII